MSHKFLASVVSSSLLVILLLATSGCSDGAKQPQAVRHAVAIEKGHECHLCGMLITEFSGPKGEIFIKDQPKAKKFCSTRDMFSFLLQPENRHQATDVWVHDMSKVAWDAPSNQQFIDAKTAWYVHGSNQTGAMGKTLASFSQQKIAEQFAIKHGGKVIQFNDINLQLIVGF